MNQSQTAQPANTAAAAQAAQQRPGSPRAGTMTPSAAFLSAESFGRPKARGGKQRVAAYIRVSTDLSDQENSYETQERYFHRLLEQNAGWVPAGVYSDYGISGTSREKRTGFKRILRHCQEGKIDRIVCKSISRFARNTKDFMEALNILNRSGVTILFEKEGLDTANPTSNFILTTLAAIAQEESRSVSANIRWGNEKRFPRGDVPNQAIYGYRFTKERITTESGYRYRAVEIVPEEAEVVRWVFAQAAEGAGHREIARELNRRQVPRRASPYTRKRMASPAKGQLDGRIDEGWTGAQISGMIRNERYTGDVLVQKTYTEDYLTHKSRRNRGEVAQYLVQGHHPAIVSRELFEEVRRTWDAAGPGTGGSRSYAFSGRLICGCCGRFYHVRNTQSHPIWFCPSTARDNGKLLCRSEKVYEEQVIHALRKAAAERFHLVVTPLREDVEVADIMSGRLEGKRTLADAASAFVAQMLERLENIQRMDFMERDRAFMKRQLLAAGAAADGARKRIQLLSARKQALDERLEMWPEPPEDAALAAGQAAALAGRLAEENARLEAAEAERKQGVERLNYLEGYWRELEDGHACRDRAMDWMRGLPPGREGAAEFLDGMTDTYAKAFVLSILIHDPLHYTVHWFDDTRTEVELYSNVEEHGAAMERFDGGRIRGK